LGERTNVSLTTVLPLGLVVAASVVVVGGLVGAAGVVAGVAAGVVVGASLTATENVQI